MTESDITSIVNCTVVEAPRILSVFSATVTSILGPVITVGNFLVVLSVIRNPNKDLRTPFNFFAVNLAIADLVVGLLTCPLSVATHVVEAGGTVANEMKTLRQSLHFSYFVSVSASLLNLAALCIDRVIAIRFPLTYRIELSFWHHVISAIFIWSVAFAVPLVYFQIGYAQMAMIMAAVSILFTFFVMLFTICMLYISVRNRPRNPSSDEVRCDVSFGLPLEAVTHRSQTEPDAQSDSGETNECIVIRDRPPLRCRSKSTALAYSAKAEGSEFANHFGIHRAIRASLSLGATPRSQSLQLFNGNKASVSSSNRKSRMDNSGELEHSRVCDVGNDCMTHSTAAKKDLELESRLLFKVDKNDKVALGRVESAANSRYQKEDVQYWKSRDDDFDKSTADRICLNTPMLGGATVSKDSVEKGGVVAKGSVTNEAEFKEVKVSENASFHSRTRTDSQMISEKQLEIDARRISYALCSCEKQDGSRCGKSEGRKSVRHKSESSSQSLRLHVPYRKLELTVLTMLSAFLICFLPSCAMIFYLNTSGGDCRLRHWMRDLNFLLAIANSAVNPFIYAWRLPPFRKAIKRIVCTKKKNQVGPRASGRNGVF